MGIGRGAVAVICAGILMSAAPVRAAGPLAYRQVINALVYEAIAD